MKMYAYDIEIFRNFALFIFIDMDDYYRIRKSLEGKSVKEFEKAIITVKKKVFVIGLGHNDLTQLVAFVNQEIILASFNGMDYDNIIVNYCIAKVNYWRTTEYVNKELYQMSQRIIANQEANIYNDDSVNVYKRMRTLYKVIDVQKVFGLNKIFKSLKQTLINLKWYNIEDYEMPPLTKEEEAYYTPNELFAHSAGLLKDWDRYVLPHHFEGIALYCLNDTLGVGEIIYQKQKDIILRFDISEEYKVNVLSSSESNIADRLFGKFYCEAAGIDFNTYIKGRTERDYVPVGACIPNNVHFSSNEFNELLTKLKGSVIINTKGELDYRVKYNDTEYDLKTGGLHSVDGPAKFILTDDIIIADADVNAYYPINVHNNRISPEHLDKDIFVNTTFTVVQDRFESKPSGSRPNKVRDKTLKIVINSGIFGKMGFPDSPVYDPMAMVTVTISGQLYLLMLVERLENAGIKVISANTDGIVSIIPKELHDTYIDICTKWSKELNFELEYTYYERYIRTNVNHYMAVKVGDGPVKDRVKYKGLLNPNLHKEDLRKGYKNPIVAKAVSNFYLFDTPVMETITEADDIMDFCATQKPNEKYSLELHNSVGGKHNVIKLSKNIRFYVSKGNRQLQSGLLLKNDTSIDEGKPRKYTNMVSGRNVTIFNKKVDYDDIKDYHIDYGYYYTEAHKIINAIESQSKIKRVIKKEYGQYKLGF